MPARAATTSCSILRPGPIRARAKVPSQLDGTRHGRVERRLSRTSRRSCCTAGLPVGSGTRTFAPTWPLAALSTRSSTARPSGFPIARERLAELRRVGHGDQGRGRGRARVVHPLEPELHGIYGTIFTGPPVERRRPAQCHDFRRRRSGPIALRHRERRAVMAVLAAMGLLGPEQTFTHESIVSGRRSGARVVGETTVGSSRPLCREIEGEAWITGEHAFVIDDRDPLATWLSAVLDMRIRPSYQKDSMIGKTIGKYRVVETPRPWRHGNGLQGDRRDARSRSRDQGAEPAIWATAKSSSVSAPRRSRSPG